MRDSYVAGCLYCCTVPCIRGGSTSIPSRIEGDPSPDDDRRGGCCTRIYTLVCSLWYALRKEECVYRVGCSSSGEVLCPVRVFFGSFTFFPYILFFHVAALAWKQRQQLAQGTVRAPLLTYLLRAYSSFLRCNSHFFFFFFFSSSFTAIISLATRLDVASSEAKKSVYV